jgi:hypothetical protein
MGGTTNTTTSTSSTAPANPDVTATQSKLLKGLQGAYDGGMKVFDKSLYAGTGSNTQAGWDATLAAAQNPAYSGAVNGAIGDFGDIAAGNRFGMNDPGYARLREKAASDALQTVGKSFGASGRFGGGSYLESAGEGVGNAIAGMDYANFQNDQQRQAQAAGMLPGLFQAGLAPGAAMGAVGGAQDADAQARLMGDNDLFRRQNDGNWDTLARSSSILAGTAPVGGMNTTNTQTSPATPWWQTAGAGVIGLGSMIF